MNERKLRWACVMLLALAVGYACTRSTKRVTATAAAVAACNLPNVLIFCDRSSGAIAEAITIQKQIEAESGNWTYATTSAQFTSRLAQDGWSDIFVLAAHSSVEPAYTAALRAYCDDNPTKLVSMLIWKPHGELPPADQAVFATSAIVSWHLGQSTIGYALAKSSPTVATAPGHLFPSFNEVETQPHINMGGFSQSPTEGDEVSSFAFAVGPPCLGPYIERLGKCRADRQEQEAECDDLYGPDEDPDDPGDPEKYQTCMAEAASDFTNCLRNAKNRWENCYAKNCPPPPPQGQ